MDDFARNICFPGTSPPDKTLVDLASLGRLSAATVKEDPSKTEYWVLRRETERLLPAEYTDPMIQSL